MLNLIFFQGNLFENFFADKISKLSQSYPLGEASQIRQAKQIKQADQPTNQPTYQPTNQPTNQSTDQAANQPAGHRTTELTKQTTPKTNNYDPPCLAYFIVRKGREGGREGSLLGASNKLKIRYNQVKTPKLSKPCTFSS